MENGQEVLTRQLAKANRVGEDIARRIPYRWQCGVHSSPLETYTTRHRKRDLQIGRPRNSAFDYEKKLQGRTSLGRGGGLPVCNNRCTTGVV
jgi:hypothetical protein